MFTVRYSTATFRYSKDKMAKKQTENILQM